MKQQHTAGEWKSKQHPMFNNGIEIYSNKKKIAELYSFKANIELEKEREILHEETAANAKLIAASPELLETLNWIVNEIETTPEQLSDALLGLIKIKAISAIKKATE